VDGNDGLRATASKLASAGCRGLGQLERPKSARLLLATSSPETQGWHRSASIFPGGPAQIPTDTAAAAGIPKSLLVRWRLRLGDDPDPRAPGVCAPACHAASH
jgi:hypothetical protein